MHTHLSHIKFCISNMNYLTLCIKLALKAKIRLGGKGLFIVLFKFLLYSTFPPFIFSIHMIYFSDPCEDNEGNSDTDNIVHFHLDAQLHSQVGLLPFWNTLCSNKEGTVGLDYPWGRMMLSLWASHVICTFGSNYQVCPYQWLAEREVNERLKYRDREKRLHSEIWTMPLNIRRKQLLLKGRR